MESNPKENSFVEFIKEDMENGRVFYNKAIYFIKRFGFKEDIAEEIYQTVVIDMVKKQPKNNPEKGTKEAFLYKCIINKCTDRLRKIRQGLEYSFSSLSKTNEEELFHIPDPSQHNPIKYLIKQENILAMKQAIQKLPIRQRYVVDLRIYGIPNEKIAELLQIPYATVKTRFHFAKKTLAKLLSE